jgi:predicted esterase
MAELPGNFSADRAAPVLIFLSERADRLDIARKIAGPNNIICVDVGGVPADLAPAALAQRCAAALEALRQHAPKLDPERSAIGGFRDGADRVGALLAAQDPFVKANFRHVVLFEGGFDALAQRGTPSATAPSPASEKGPRVLLLRGERSTVDAASVARAEAAGKAAGLDVFSALIRGFDGRAEHPPHQVLIGQWIRGSRIPADIIAVPHEELQQRFARRTFSHAEGQTLPYRLFVPENYDRAKKYPLVVFLHGSGESGDNNDAQILSHGAGQFADASTQKKHPAFVVAPQCPRAGNWGFVNFGASWPADAMIELVRALQREFSIDADRVYITGLSLGGYGTWRAITEHPTLFAAAAPVAAAGDVNQLAKIKHIPVWAFHGDRDTAVPISGRGRAASADSIVGNRDVIEALKAQGAPAKLTVYEREGHGIWLLAYNEPGLMDWMFAQRRAAASAGP